MYLTIKQQLKDLSKEDYLNLKELSHIAKNLYNEALYNIRQYFFKEKEYLQYGKNYDMLKTSPNYKLLNSNMAQQILREVDGDFESFFSLLKLAKKGEYDSKSVNIPHYLEKDGYTTLVIGFVRINKNQLIIPYSNSYRKTHSKIKITIPPNLSDKNIKEIKIIPRSKARFFEIHYTYEVCEDERKLDKTNALSIDLGLSNLATCVTNKGESFIIDGRRLKSLNQWYNKENAKLQSIKDKYGITGITKKQSIILKNRNNQVNDYMNKTCRYIINYCLDNDIGNLIIGYNEGIKNGINLGNVNNQNFVNVPIGSIKKKLSYLCEFYGINFASQEESYTSKASFFDKDVIPTYDPKNPNKYEFSGKRDKRRYITKDKKMINADVNGALNIMAKSRVVDLSILYSRGEVDTPVRIRIA